MTDHGVASAERSALGGIQRASARFDGAAATIAREGAAFSAPDKVEISSEARALAAGSAGPIRLVEALTDERIAGHAHRANLKTLQTTDEMTDDLLRLL
jgi:hypothetical protein